MIDENFDYGALTEMGDDEVPKVYVNPSRNYKAEEYYLTIRLSDLQGATITAMEGDDGREVRGLFLPFKESGLTVTPKKNVLLVCKAELAQVAARYTHVLTQICDKEVWQERNRLGFKQQIIGHMRNINFKKK